MNIIAMNEGKNIKSAFKKDGMFNEANYWMFELAKDLRKNMTHAEMVLWSHLKGGVNGLKCRRQHPIGIYIVDFYCHKIRVIVEVDGKIHDKEEVKKYDLKRENDLKSWGYKIFRFTNERVLRDTSSVIAEISDIVESLNKSS